MTLGEFKQLTEGLAEDTPIKIEVQDIFNRGEYVQANADALVSTDKSYHNKTICSATEIIIFEE